MVIKREIWWLVLVPLILVGFLLIAYLPSHVPLPQIDPAKLESVPLPGAKLGAFSKDGSRAVVYRDSGLTEIDMERLQPTRTVRPFQESELAWGPCGIDYLDDQRLAVLLVNSILIADLNSSDQVTRRIIPAPRCFAVVSQESTIYFGTRTGEVGLWNYHNDFVKISQPLHKGCVWSVLYLASQGLVLSAGSDGVVYSSRAKDLVLVDSVHHGREVNTMAIDSGESRLALGFADGYISCVPLSKKESFTWHAHRGQIQALAFLRAHDRLVSCGTDGVAKGWDLSLAKGIMQHRETPPFFFSAFSVPRDRLLIGNDRHLKVIHLRDLVP